MLMTDVLTLMHSNPSCLVHVDDIDGRYKAVHQRHWTNKPDLRPHGLGEKKQNQRSNLINVRD